MPPLESFKIWQKLAQNDLEWAEHCIDYDKWVLVGVHCQQALEKLAKGMCILFIGKEAHRTHNINEVIRAVENYLSKPITDDAREVFGTLSRFYIEGRYPDIEGDTKFELNETEARYLYSQSKEIFEWLLTSIPSTTLMPIEQSKQSLKP